MRFDVLFLFFCLVFFNSFKSHSKDNTLLKVNFYKQHNREIIKLTFKEDLKAPVMISNSHKNKISVVFKNILNSANQNKFPDDFHLLKSFKLKYADLLKVVVGLNSNIGFLSSVKDNECVLTFYDLKDKTLPDLNLLNNKNFDDVFSIDVRNIPIADLLTSIAAMKKYNLVISSKIKGNISLSINNSSFDNLLQTILPLHSLVKKKIGNYFVVFPLSELSQIARNNSLYNDDYKGKNTALEKFKTEIIKINYTSSKKIAKLIKNASNYSVSKYGYIAYDEEQNFLLIHEVSSKIKAFKDIVSKLDVPVKQVVIEAKIVTVRSDASEDFGVRWKTISRVNFNASLPAVSEKGSVATWSTGIADVNNLLDLELSALETENLADILASPKIVVANNHLAVIEQGVEIPYVVKSSNDSSSVSFKKAALSLTVKPRILSNNNVFLDLQIHQDHRGDTILVADSQTVSIDMQRISSKVLVKNNETLVIGGIYQKRSIKILKKVPILGDIPFFKFLFNSSKIIFEKYEVLIFVTPRVV